MSEREYRAALAAALERVSREARRYLLPAAFGVSVALGAGGCTDAQPIYGIPIEPDQHVPRPDMAYGVDAPPPADQGLDLRPDAPTPDAGVDASADAPSAPDTSVDARADGPLVGPPDAVYGVDIP